MREKHAAGRQQRALRGMQLVREIRKLATKLEKDMKLMKQIIEKKDTRA